MRSAVVSIRAAAALAAINLLGSAVHAARPVFPLERYSLGRSAEQVMTGDFDENGTVDIAVLGTIWGDLNVLLGDGEGRFVQQATLDIYGSYSAAIADFNSDGHLDVATWNLVQRRWRTLLGRGDGTFDGIVTSPASGSSFRYLEELAPTDLNGDGATDLVAIVEGHWVGTYLGLGDGSFVDADLQSFRNRVEATVVLDVDVDGVPDVLAASYWPGLLVLRGTGDGTLNQPETLLDEPAFRGLALADVDGDRVADLVAAVESDTWWTDLAVLIRRGDGSFGPPTVTGHHLDIRDLGVGDFDGDGNVDVFAGRESTFATTVRGLGGGRFDAPVTQEFVPFPKGLAVADFDSDGRADLALTPTTYPRGVVVAFGGPRGLVFSDETRIYEPVAALVRDLDGDGAPEVAVVAWNSALAVFRSDSRAPLLPVQSVMLYHGPFGRLATADFDEDGIPDIVATGFKVQVLLGRGDATFGDPVLLSESPYNTVDAVTTADFDGDGHQDFAISLRHWSGDNVSVFLGAGDGSFAAPGRITTAPTSRKLVAGDFDGDSRVDLVLFDGMALTVFRGQGNGSFVRSKTTALPSYPRDMAAEDIDHDGTLDVALLLYPQGDSLSRVAVLWGRGDGGFDLDGLGPEYGDGGGIVLEDVDGDGWSEIAVSRGVEVDVFRHIDSRRFDPPQHFWTGVPSVDLASGDLDGDRRPDLVKSTGAGLQLIWNQLGPPNRPPVAEAGSDQVLECTSFAGAVATLDGGGSTDPDPGDFVVSWSWSIDGGSELGGATVLAELPLGEHHALLTVTDGAGARASDEVRVTVRDTRPPSGQILSPVAGACLGPARLPVRVEDDYTDICDPAVVRAYDPPEGPSYTAHGDYHVTVTASDASANAVISAIDFTIDVLSPKVVIVSPVDDDFIAGRSLDLALFFSTTDDDGASGDVIHEVLKVAGCPVLDGAETGDGDGLLSDESVTLDVATLCRAASACGWSTLHAPEIRVEATDCGGNVGSDSLTFPGSLALLPGLCGR